MVRIECWAACQLRFFPAKGFCLRRLRQISDGLHFYEAPTSSQSLACGRHRMPSGRPPSQGNNTLTNHPQARKASRVSLSEKSCLIGFVGVTPCGYPDLMRFLRRVDTGVYPYIGLFRQARVGATETQAFLFQKIESAIMRTPHKKGKPPALTGGSLLGKCYHRI